MQQLIEPHSVWKSISTFHSTFTLTSPSIFNALSNRLLHVIDNFYFENETLTIFVSMCLAQHGAFLRVENPELHLLQFLAKSNTYCTFQSAFPFQARKKDYLQTLDLLTLR